MMIYNTLNMYVRMMCGPDEHIMHKSFVSVSAPGHW